MFDFARAHVVIGLIYFAIAMAVGLVMGFTMNSDLVVVHAHVMLIGGLMSFAYGVLAKLWLVPAQNAGLRAQFTVHHVATLGVGACSPLFYGTGISHAILGPVLGIFSALVFVGTLQMLALILRAPRA